MRYLIPMLLIVNAAFSIGPYFITTGGIDDYGFDEELVSSNFPDWTFSGSGSFIREEYREYDGESYAIVDASTSGDNYFYQDLDADDLKEGQTYFLSFRYKILDDDLTVSTGGGAKVELAINEGPLSGTVYAATKPVSDETGDNWGMARVAFTARSTDSRFSVGMWDASGTLCVDDVRINVMEEDVGGTLVNPDFEPLGTVGPAPFGWTATPGLGGTITTVGGDIRSGSGAVDISQTSSGTSTLTQTITIDQMTRYRGYIYFYTDDVVGTGARVRIYQNKQLGTEELFLSDTYTGDNAWHRLPIDFTTIDDGTTITFELKLQATGTARFDGLFIRKMPILAGDFNDDDWDDYWLTDQASEGVVSRVDDPESIGNKVLEIENTGDGDTTTVYQDIAAIDGLSYVFSGRVRVDELASILDDKYGGYIKLIDNATEAIVDSAGPFTVEDEWTTWGLYGFAGPVEGAPPANRFRVELILYEASGTMFVDDVEVYSEALNDMVTVLPQPASADRRNTYGRVGDEEWYIVYDDSEIVGDPTRDDDAFRCADDVRNDLIFDEEIHPNYFHYFGIEEDINLVALSQYNPATHKPALLILDPDTQLYQTWVDGLMEDHGITEPEVAGLGDEGYYLDTGYDGGDEEVLILSTTAKGRYYGTQTFLQLLQHPMHIGENATKVYDYPDVTIYDTPEMPIRGVDIGEHTYKVKPGETGFDKREYQAFLFRERESEKGEGNPRRTPIEVYVRLMSRIKINTVLIETPMFYCLDYTDKYIDTDRIGLAESSNLDVLQRIFDYCRDYYIEPVPVLQSLGHACQMLQFVGTSAAENWLSVEACWVGDPDGYDADEIPLPQLLEVFEESNYTLDNPYVIESSERPITVYELDGDGDIVYGMIEGSDYTVDYIGMDFDLVRGYSFPEPWPVGSRNCKLNITRALPKGHEWAVEYHFINQPRLKAYWHAGFFSYCPTSTVIQGFMEDAIDIVVEELQPRYVHFGHDEPQQIFTCEECREIVPEEGVTEPGQLFADSINTLVGYYEDACIAEYGSAAFEQGQKDGYYRTMIYADHVSTPHEEYKVPSPPGNWWYYRGSTIPKWISTCKTEIEKSVIMADWNYITEDEDLPSLPLLKYRYIDDLTDAGFDVVGVSEGHANHGGGIERVDPWAGATVSCDLEYRNEELDLTIYKQFNGLAYEGTMQHYLPLYNADIELYGSSQYWFTREEFGGYRNHRIQIPDINTNPLYETYPTAAWLSCDIRGKSAQGEVWFDDLELSWKNEEALNWRPLVRPEEDNGDFDDEGSGNRTFDEWDDPPLLWNDTVRAEVAYDDDIHRDVSPGPDTASCKFFIDVINEADLENPISHPTSFIAGEEVLIDDFTQTRGYVRTREVDTLRLGCPRQWMDCGLKFEQAMAITYGTYLGAVLNLTRGLPFDDRPFVVGWKSNADAIGIADYNWSPRFPRTPYLKYLWWDPYVTCLKEVTW